MLNAAKIPSPTADAGGLPGRFLAERVDPGPATEGKSLFGVIVTAAHAYGDVPVGDGTIRPPGSCYTVKRLLRLYFWQGQNTTHGPATGVDPGFWGRHRKLVATMLPALLVHIVWWSIMVDRNLFYLFNEPSGPDNKPRYLMSITMIFGSMIAGATSEGGGAIAFPVMTLALGISPPVARDFSFMIQSVGMVAAAFAILTMKIRVEWHALINVTVGGVAGLIFGLEKVAPELTPPYAKMYFVATWSSFAIGLYMLNRHRNRVVFEAIPRWEQGVIARAPGALGAVVVLNWKQATLLATGFLGGIFSAVAGSGIDICSFAVLTLLFRIDEKVATPTSVILMGINTVVGFAYREFGQGGVEEEAWGFVAVCAPIVVLGAPLGSFLGSHFHRLTLAGTIYLIDLAQLIGALYVVRPWTTTKTTTPANLTGTSIAVFVGGCLFFQLLSHVGLKLLPGLPIAELPVAAGRPGAGAPPPALLAGHAGTPPMKVGSGANEAPRPSRPIARRLDLPHDGPVGVCDSSATTTRVSTV